MRKLIPLTATQCLEVDGYRRKQAPDVVLKGLYEARADDFKLFFFFSEDDKTVHLTAEKRVLFGLIRQGEKTAVANFEWRGSTLQFSQPRGEFDYFPDFGCIVSVDDEQNLVLSLGQRREIKVVKSCLSDQP